MKTIIIVTIAFSALIGLALYVNRPKPPTAIPATAGLDTNEPAVGLEPQSAGPITGSNRASLSAARRVDPQPVATAAVAEPAPAPSVASAIGLNQAVDVLLNPRSTHEQKQAVWKELRDSGKLDDAIKELEKRTAANPQVADYSAALGQAYLQKCGTIKDVREQGILAMQADKLFEAALNLDPANWDARFTRYVAMSYWPPVMNRGQEVISNFELLIQQQEAQPPQPQFADTYLWLGDQYVKAGRSDDAQATWQRGLKLFPDNTALLGRLNKTP